MKGLTPPTILPRPDSSDDDDDTIDGAIHVVVPDPATPDNPKPPPPASKSRSRRRKRVKVTMPNSKRPAKRHQAQVDSATKRSKSDQANDSGRSSPSESIENLATDGGKRKKAFKPGKSKAGEWIQCLLIIVLSQKKKKKNKAFFAWLLSITVNGRNFCSTGKNICT